MPGKNSWQSWANRKIWWTSKIAAEHFLLGLADATEKGLNEYDKIFQNDGVISLKVRIQKHDESGPTRTIRTVCKAFQKHGSEQAGVMSHFVVPTS